MKPGLFITREGHALVRIIKMDDHYVDIVRLDGKGQWSMPRADYEARFVDLYRPATADDLMDIEQDVPNFTLPENAPPEWAVLLGGTAPETS